MKTVYRLRMDWFAWVAAGLFFIGLIAAGIGGIVWIAFLIFLFGFGCILVY